MRLVDMGDPDRVFTEEEIAESNEWAEELLETAPAGVVGYPPIPEEWQPPKKSE